MDNEEALILVDPAMPLETILEEGIDASLLLAAREDPAARTVWTTWQVALELLGYDISRHIFQRYLAELEPLRFDPGRRILYLGAADENQACFLADRFKAVIDRKLRAGFQPEARVEFVAPGADAPGGRRVQPHPGGGRD